MKLIINCKPILPFCHFGFFKFTFFLFVSSVHNKVNGTIFDFTLFYIIYLMFNFLSQGKHNMHLNIFFCKAWRWSKLHSLLRWSEVTMKLHKDPTLRAEVEIIFYWLGTVKYGGNMAAKTREFRHLSIYF